MKRRNTFPFHFPQKSFNEEGHVDFIFFYVLYLFVFTLTSILIAYSYFSINYQYNKDVRLPSIQGRLIPDGYINLSLELQKGRVVVSTDDRKVFAWSSSDWKTQDIKKLISYLIKRIEELSYESILSLKLYEQKFFPLASY